MQYYIVYLYPLRVALSKQSAVTALNQGNNYNCKENQYYKDLKWRYVYLLQAQIHLVAIATSVNWRLKFFEDDQLFHQSKRS